MRPGSVSPHSAMKFCVGICVSLFVVAAGRPAQSALLFNFTDGPTLLALEAGDATQQATAASVKAGFQAAAAAWSAKFNDPITVNITIDYTTLPGTLLGNTTPNYAPYAYSQVKGALAADISPNSTFDATAVSKLPAGPAFNVVTMDRLGNRYFDNNNSINNLSVNVLFANAKALGLPVSNPTGLPDASVAMSSTAPWDFSHGAVIDPTKYDFVGVATHELGHALGFSSSVDVLDLFSGLGPNATVQGAPEQDASPVLTVLDLYRHSADATSHSTTTLDVSPGGTPFFSFDGTTNLGLFSTGRYNGNGAEASHWKDNLGLGIMDPTFAKGEHGDINARDVMSLDAIGYNPVPVPEPATWLTMGLGALGLVIANRRGR